MTDSQPELSFFARFALAFVCFWRVLFNQAFAQAVLPVRQADKAGALTPGAPSPAELPARGEVVEFKAVKEAAPPPPEREHASALQVLSMLQREGRLIDFLQEEVAPFSDAEVGAAAFADGLEIHGLEETGESLEDVFLRLTESPVTEVAA